MVIFLATSLSAFWFSMTCFTMALIHKKFPGDNYGMDPGAVMGIVFSIAIWPFILGFFACTYILAAAERKAELDKLTRAAIDGAKIERQQHEKERAKKEEEALAPIGNLEPLPEELFSLQPARPNPTAPERRGWPKPRRRD